MKFALTWDFAGNIIARKASQSFYRSGQMLFAFVWKYTYGYFLKYFLFKNILFFLFFKNYF